MVAFKPIFKSLGGGLIVILCCIPIGLYFLLVGVVDLISLTLRALRRASSLLTLRLRSNPSVYRLVEKSNLCYKCRSIRLATLKRGLLHHSSYEAIRNCGKTCPLCDLLCRAMVEGVDSSIPGILRRNNDQEIGQGDLVTLVIGNMVGQLHISCASGNIRIKSKGYQEPV